VNAQKDSMDLFASFEIVKTQSLVVCNVKMEANAVMDKRITNYFNNSEPSLANTTRHIAFGNTVFVQMVSLVSNVSIN
jgi:hypothetical protein